MIIKTLFPKTALALAFVAVLASGANAQADPDFEAIQRQMLQMQRRMMEQLRQPGFPDNNWAWPGDSSQQFFFKIDTTFGGGDFGFFRTVPFGGDSTASEFERFFQQFFPDEKRLGSSPQPDGSEFLDETGEGDLLPEERLRLREENGAAPPYDAPAPPQNAPKPAAQPKKRATTRI